MDASIPILLVEACHHGQTTRPFYSKSLWWKRLIMDDFEESGLGLKHARDDKSTDVIRPNMGTAVAAARAPPRAQWPRHGHHHRQSAFAST